MNYFVRMRKNLVSGSRIGRLDYTIYAALSGIFFYAATFLCVYLYPSLLENNFIYMLGLIVSALVNFRIGQCRARDLNMNLFYYIATSFIPIVNLIVLIFLFFERGTKGDNQFGPDPLI